MSAKKLLLIHFKTLKYLPACVNTLHLTSSLRRLSLLFDLVCAINVHNNNKSLKFTQICRLHKSSLCTFIPLILGIYSRTKTSTFLTFTNVTPGVFYSWIPIDIWQQTQAEALCVVWWISVAIHNNAWRRRMKYFPNTIVQFIIGNRTPVLWLLICNWLNIYENKSYETQSN